MREHGTYAAYKVDGCRCNPCGLAASNYRTNRTLALANGTWNPYTPAAPIRTHIHTLQTAGIGTRSIAKAAGLARQTLQYVLHGRTNGPAPTHIRTTTAEAVLAVDLTIDTLPATARIPATGIRRRTQALAAAGWPRNHVATQAGMYPNNLTALLRIGRATVATSRLIRDTYNQLWDIDPTTCGVAPWVVEQTRRQALAAGWAPPIAWDDQWLDLPDDDLTAELARLAAAMDNAETGRCYRARLNGDPSPLIAAGATEYNRRRKAATRKETAA